MLSQLQRYGAPDVIVPVRLGDVEDTKKRIEWLHEKFGFTRFCIDGLSKGHRATGYPTREDYLIDAEIFAEARAWVKEMGMSVGWFCNLTVKSGPFDNASIIRPDGSPHPFANCPLDESFAERLSSDIAYFASIARPDFVFLEDDFSIGAAQGCFCERHLSALEKRLGKRYGREELVGINKRDDTEALAIRQAWGDVKRESLVSLAKKIRHAFDEACPEIPVGLEQSGASDVDGDMTEAVSLALAGERHTPFVRLHGTYYCGFDAKRMPSVLFNSIYKTEHMSKEILRYHESDSYPHMRYYSSAVEMCALMSAAYSYGMIGSIFFAQQWLDEPWEEDAYGKRFMGERRRLEALCALGDAEPFGVEITYDPFYNTVGGGPNFPRFVGRLGIPFTTKRSNVAFWDGTVAKYADDKTVLDYLSRGLILDGDGAEALTKRGFGKHLGVSVGEPLSKKNPRLTTDLGATEVITDAFLITGLGRRMQPAHAYCPTGASEWLEVAVTDSKTQVITEARDSRGNVISPAMTYFENELGGRVCVISQGLRGNNSQSIYNYRRAALIRNIVKKMSDEYPLAECAPDVYIIAVKRAGNTVLTLINLCTDDAEELGVYLPPALRNKELLTLNASGIPESLKATKTEKGIRLTEPLSYCKPKYIIIKGTSQQLNMSPVGDYLD